MQLKKRMSFKQGTEFEVAYWSIKQQNPDQATFRALVIGKTPEQIIDMGKEYFTERKLANDPKYTQHENWDMMIAEVIAKIKTPATKKNLGQATPAQNKANRIQGF
jgi:hypothetical protein